MRPLRIIFLTVGSLLALLSVGLLAAGGALVGIHATQRDDDGFYASDVRTLATSTYALTSEDVDLQLDADGTGWGFVEHLGTARVDVTAPGGGPVFVGIAPADQVDAYLAGSAHDEVVDVHRHGVDYQRATGERRPARPDTQDLWVASTEGTGRQRLQWDVESGHWSVVVMNADASRGIAVEAAIGMKTGILLPIGIGLLGLAVVLGALGAVAIIASLRHRDEVAAAAVTGERVAGSYPVRLRGELDPELSRWRWLVKWLLVLPHAFVLALLWPVTAVLTVVAGFAILFTGRYPRSLFDFNVGVMRWTWRVTFYAFTFGTDRYPPFSLDPDPYYPADLEVDPPATLSRGLVLVKWWLLALPHYLVLAVFGGGVTWWGWGLGSGGDGRAIGGVGLIGLLAIVAGVVLLVTKRYPQSIFDFLMGMHRWTYRVLAYAALMRDEYPPFRLDVGGRDPGSPPPADATGTLAQAA